jgi:PAS domain S-box-containing protein
MIPDTADIPALLREAPAPNGPGADDIREILGAALEWLPIGILVVNREGVIVVVNHEIERLFGYMGGELVGQSVDILVPDAIREAHAAYRDNFSEHPRARRMAAGHELFGRRKDASEVPIEVRLTPIHIRDVGFVLASVIDVSEQPGMQPRLQAALEDRFEFERLISELGAEFVNLRPDDVDRTIEDALGRLVRVLALDRSALFQLDESGDFVHTHQWTRPGWPPPLPRISAAKEFPWHLEHVRAGELVSFSAVSDVPDEIDRESLKRLGTKSAVAVPLTIGGQVWGAMTFASVREPRTWTPALLNRLRVVALIFAHAIARRREDQQLRKLVDESAALRDRLRDENQYLRGEIRSLTGTPAVVGHSTAIRRVLEQVRQVAGTDSTVLIQGETGTGKAILAARIHELSARREHAMVRVNCAALCTAWIEGELFGSERGALTERDSRHIGRLELASGSTVFLDEVTDLPLEAQATLMRVLQENQVQPIGSDRAVKVDVRVIAATCRDLKRCIKDGTFRDDLYYRLNVFPIHVPPLRERREDVPLLVWRFVDEFSAAFGKPIDSIDQGSMAALEAYMWPGNARELRNVVERAMIVATGRRLRIPLPNGIGRAGSAHRRRKRP